MDPNQHPPNSPNQGFEEKLEEMRRRTQRQRSIYRIGSGCWLIGTMLIALSWFSVVPPEAGWFGFLLSLIGALMQFFSNRRW